MRLYEWLILAAWVPLWWFGSLWAFRLLAAFAAFKLGRAAVDQIKGGVANGNGDEKQTEGA